MIGLLAILLLAGLAAWPVVAELLLRPAPPARVPRVRLTTGETHYRWQGPKEGPVAVCIHGLTTPSQVFDPLAHALAGRGWRVLVYDLPGRGASGGTLPPQDRDMFLRQIDGVLQACGVTEIDLLMGYSMGGAIATCFAAARPEKVAKLALLAPAGFYYDPGRLGRFTRDVPVLGDWLMVGFGGWLMRRALRNATGGQGAAGLRRLQIAQTRIRGFLPAVLSSQRNMLRVYLGAEHKHLADCALPVLAVWGEEDEVIPVSNIGRLAEVNRTAWHETVPGAGHGLPHTHPEAVMAVLEEFLRGP